MSIPPDKPSPIVPGYRLDRYELLCPLAQGGMASVWVARQTGKHGFEKLVAIKTILPQFSADHRFRKMFLDEAHIAAGIEHPNVAQILDLGEQHDVLYIAMEWVDGDSLSKLHRTVEKKNLAIPPAIVLRILADACGGLHAAHELRDRDGELLNVVHRDVSPQNVLVSNRGVAKIIDFGVAKARDRVAEDTNAGILKGKIQYMAPEQAVGKLIDRRADVWAVGAILYHLLAGKAPFDAPNQLAVLHRLSSGKPPLPLPGSVPKPVSDVVRAALTHDMAKRIATAHDLQLALEEAMQRAGLRATTADVASYLREHLADRNEARKKAVEVALQAAAERARIAQVLSIPSRDSVSGVDDPRFKSAPEIGSLNDLAPPKSEPATTHGIVAGSTGTAIAPPSMGGSSLAGRGKFVAIGAAALVVLVVAIALTTRSKSEPAPIATPAAQPIATHAVAPTSSAPAVQPTVAEMEEAPAASAAPSTTTVAAKTIVAPKATTTTSSSSSAAQKKGWKKIDDGF